MPRPKSGTASRAHKASGQGVSLKSLAEHLGLSQAAVSLVINRSPGAKSIPHRTQELIRKAARELNYRPNHLARSLRQQRSYTIGVVVPEISEGYAALVMSGIEDHLLREGYFYFVVSHRHRDELIEEYPLLLQQRAVEGLIAVDTAITSAAQVPTVAVSGHRELPGVTNIVLDHARAAALAMEHLTNLGHRQMAFIKGQAFSSDTAIRWESVRNAAQEVGVRINERLVGQLEGESSSPELGYQVAKKLLASGENFTALFAFNDISAIGAIQALREAGRRIPQDVSVVGFDDIQSAAFQNPALTTVRQPLREMGMLAAETLLRRISAPHEADYPKEIVVQPELICRASTAAAPGPS
ncbi:MAG: LacI family transcriptional regulator [Acidobacteria bacterium]|nr:MAG: LacI family transcriptional regulator [Acidobacteriota bacterium]